SDSRIETLEASAQALQYARRPPVEEVPDLLVNPPPAQKMDAVGSGQPFRRMAVQSKSPNDGRPVRQIEGREVEDLTVSSIAAADNCGVGREEMHHAAS